MEKITNIFSKYKKDSNSFFSNFFLETATAALVFFDVLAGGFFLLNREIFRLFAMMYQILPYFF